MPANKQRRLASLTQLLARRRRSWPTSCRFSLGFHWLSMGFPKGPISFIGGPVCLKRFGSQKRLCDHISTMGSHARTHAQTIGGALLHQSHARALWLFSRMPSFENCPEKISACRFACACACKGEPKSISEEGCKPNVGWVLAQGLQDPGALVRYSERVVSRSRSSRLLGRTGLCTSTLASASACGPSPTHIKLQPLGGPKFPAAAGEKNLHLQKCRN